MSLKYGGDADKRPAHTRKDYEEAAIAFHTWLQKPDCAFRAFLQITSTGGAIYAAQMAELARARMQHGGGTQETCAVSVIARHLGGDKEGEGSGGAQASNVDDPTAGLW